MKSAHKHLDVAIARRTFQQTDKLYGVSSSSQRAARYEKCSLTFDSELALG